MLFAISSSSDDGLTARAPIKERFPDFADLLAGAHEVDALTRLRAAETIGRPLGDDRFMARIERLTKRWLRAGKRGQSRSDGKTIKCNVAVM